MTSARKGFNKVFDYVKKLEEVIQVGQSKMLAKKYRNVGHFSGSFLKSHDHQAYAACPIQSALLASTVIIANVCSYVQVARG